MMVLDHIRSMFGVSRVAFQLRRAGFSAVAGPFLKGTAVPGQNNIDAAREIRLTMRSARLPWSTCLTRSIWLCRRLSARGHRPQLVLGIHAPSMNQQRDLKAHAWVTVGQQVIDEDMSANADFRPLTANANDNMEQTR